MDIIILRSFSFCLQKFYSVGNELVELFLPRLNHRQLKIA